VNRNGSDRIYSSDVGCEALAVDVLPVAYAVIGTLARLNLSLKYTIETNVFS
jgi:hypothetical protein